MTVICQYMTNIQYISLSWILMFLVQELLYFVHACSSCPTLFPDAVVTGICWLILRCFFPGCTRLARLNAAHLLRPKGTLGQAQTILFSQVALAPFLCPPLPPLLAGGEAASAAAAASPAGAASAGAAGGGVDASAPALAWSESSLMP